MRDTGDLPCVLFYLMAQTKTQVGFILTKSPFMHKLRRDMKKLGTKRVPEYGYPEREGRWLEAFL